MRKNIFHWIGGAVAVVMLMVFLAPSSLSYGQQAGNKQKSLIKDDLHKELKLLKEGEFVRVIIRMESQLPKQERRKVLAEAKRIKNKKKRRKIFVNALKGHAKKHQGDIHKELKKLEKKKIVKNIRLLWISNVVTAEVRKEALDEIIKVEGIKHIKQDIKRQVFQAPAWGVSLINADDVWTTPGLNGNGIVVAVLDTGIDLDHPDLVNHLWSNPVEAAGSPGVDDDGNGYIDDVVGWDLINDDNTPDDWHGHGTHVAGTVAGDGSGGTATGVAPGARIMVLSYSADPYGAGQAEAWEGMQYALENGADIVNFSSGWIDDWSPDYETWRNNSETLIDAGVLFVVAAGNTYAHSPAPDDILTPGRVPRVLTLGATDDTDTIASFSCLGPTSWEGVPNFDDYIYPPGLLKPDVSAPGEAVESCQNGGGYMDMDGTSMAAPHAAGVAALLLEQNPALRPHEIVYILRETAVDLGIAGPDNVYGYGRIDAQAAVNHSYSNTPVYDLSVTGTNSVWTTVDIWVDNNDDGTPEDPVANNDNHLYARIRNTGGQAVGNVEVKFYYADVGTIGISGFDPNNDGNPDDGNFTYIDSYFVPVIGPSGSSQDTAVAVVKWNVPVPTTDHWCVGIGIVAHDPPNDPETVTTNNRAFRNFFDIVVIFNQVNSFDFLVYPHPRFPGDPFDLEVIREGLPNEFDVQLVMDKRIANDWFKKSKGFEIIKKPPLKNMPIDEEKAMKRGEFIPAFVKLLGKQGILRGIRAPGGKPVRVTAQIRAPGKEEAAQMRVVKENIRLVINAMNEKEVFGGLTFDIKLEKDDTPVVVKEKKLYELHVEDADEAGLIEQRFKIKFVTAVGRILYYYGDEQLNIKLKELGFEPTEADPKDVFRRIVKLTGFISKKALKKANVKILLDEGCHWIVQATANQLKALSGKGARVKKVIVDRIRPRRVEIYITKRDQTRGIAPFMNDFYSVDHVSEGQYVIHGTAWDDGIEAIRAKGFKVKIIKGGK